MSAQADNRKQKSGESHPTGGFFISRSRFTAALILMALGGVFFLQQAGVLDHGSNWWVIFIAIPGLVILGSALVTASGSGRFSPGVMTEIVIGLLLLVLAAIFIWDPTWSFTRGWRLDRTFPLLIQLSPFWPWVLIIIGAGLIFLALRQRSWTPAVFGAALCIIGAVFLLNISWDIVWPLFLVGLGAWLLLKRNVQA
jgi:hypothetical protein